MSEHSYAKEFKTKEQIQALIDHANCVFYFIYSTTNCKIDKSKLVHDIQDMQQRQIDHLKKDMTAISTLGESMRCRRRRLREQIKLA